MFVRVARQRTSFVAEQRRSHCSIVLERRRVSFVSGGKFSISANSLQARLKYGSC